MSNWSQTKTPYLVTIVGVAIMAITEIYSSVRALMFRAMFRPGGGNFSGAGGFAGPRQFGGGGFGFGFTNYLVLLGLLIAIIGVVWLGVALRKSPKSS